MIPKVKQTNTGRTHFKKGMIPHNKGKSYFLKERTGEKVGRLTVISHISGLNGRSSWMCECECGSNSIVRADRLKITRSCGCLQREYAKTTGRYNAGNQKGELHPSYKHGLSKTKEYSLAQVHKRIALKKKFGGSFTPEQWSSLKEKFNFMCLCCKQQEPFIKLEVDHIVPLSVWGVWAKKNKPNYKVSDIENIQPLCRSCNSRKKDKIINYLNL
jgi:5-methylcytosine-specific restriction endonuclease McrA